MLTQLQKGDPVLVTGPDSERSTSRSGQYGTVELVATHYNPLRMKSETFVLVHFGQEESRKDRWFPAESLLPSGFYGPEVPPQDNAKKLYLDGQHVATWSSFGPGRVIQSVDAEEVTMIGVDWSAPAPEQPVRTPARILCRIKELADDAGWRNWGLDGGTGFGIGLFYVRYHSKDGLYISMKHDDPAVLLRAVAAILGVQEWD